MKKSFYLLALLFTASTIFIGCRSDDPYEPTPPPPPTEYIVVDCEEALTQTVYANEEAGESTVSFTTLAPWTSSINEVRSSGALRSVTDSWVTITPDRGNAGTHEIEITLEPNLTGADRTVEIIITSGGSSITIRITQRYVKECGTTHLPVYTFEFTVFEANEAWVEDAEGRFLSENATVTLYRLVNGEYTEVDEILTDAYGVAIFTSSYTDLLYKVTKGEKGRLYDGFVVAGIFTSKEEAARIPYPETGRISNPRPGSVKVVDINGDGVIDDRDQVESTRFCIAVPEAASTETPITTEATIISPDFVARLCITTDEGVTINGIRWATRNVDMPGTFAENPEDAGMFFQWNRRVGWSSTYSLVNSDGGTVWDNTTPEGTIWERENDPCPPGWRVPTRWELQTLFDAGSEWTAQNEVNGRLFGSYPNQIFLPAVGRIFFNGVLNGANVMGHYSSSTLRSVLSGVYNLRFSSSDSPFNTTVSAWGMHAGTYSIRCVEDVFIPVTSITLNHTDITLPVVGSSFRPLLAATIAPGNATNRAVTWTSSNPNIVSVNDTGNPYIHARGVGSATITVAATDGSNVSASVAVTVTAAPTISSSLDGVVIDGIRWATRNVDAPGTFAASPESAGMFFQWNRRVGWSSTDPLINSDGGTIWDDTIPDGTAWYPENDPCPTGWRVPTQQELESLASSGSVWMWHNGVNGRLFGTAPNQLFLPASGWRVWHTGAYGLVGNIGSFWSSSWDASLSIGSHISMFNDTSRTGNSVRCVAIE